MKYLILLLFLVHKVVFSQEIAQKTFFSESDFIEIETTGIDEITIENSNNSEIEILLLGQISDGSFIIANDENSVLKIGFEIDFLQEDITFRKYITERLDRVSVVIKIPKNRDVTILGSYVDVISKSYQGDLNIYIDKGLIKLGDLQANADVKLFQGNVYAIVENAAVKIHSNKGVIFVDNKKYPIEFIKESYKLTRRITIHSIEANVFLSTK